jgi:O-antigen/teichoic acid export membrane protein
VRKNLLLSVISQSLRYGAQSILFIIIARIYGVEEFGVFMVAFTVSIIMNVFLDFGLNIKSVIDIPSGSVTDIEFLKSSLNAKYIIGLAMLILLLLGSYFVNTDLKKELILLLCLSVVGLSFGNLFTSIHRANNNFNYDVYSNVIQYILLFSSVWVAWLYSLDIVYVALGFFFSRTVFSLVSWFFLKLEKSVFHFKVVDGFNLLRAAWPFAFISSISVLYINTDNLLISFFLDDESVGIYQAGFKVMMVTMIIPEIIVLFGMPLLSMNLKRRPALFKKHFHVIHMALLFLGLTAACSIGFFGHNIVSLLFGLGFQEVSDFMWYFSVIAFLRYLGAATGMLLLIFGDEKKRVKVLSSMLVVSVSLNIILIPELGLLGAVLTSLVVHVGLNVLYYIMSYSSWRSNPILITV